MGLPKMNTISISCSLHQRTWAGGRSKTRRDELHRPPTQKVSEEREATGKLRVQCLERGNLLSVHGGGTDGYKQRSRNGRIC